MLKEMRKKNNEKINQHYRCVKIIYAYMVLVFCFLFQKDTKNNATDETERSDIN